MLQSRAFIRPASKPAMKKPSLIPRNSKAVLFFGLFFSSPMILTRSFSVASSDLYSSQFPLHCFSCVLTLNFGALLFKGATRPLPLPLKNAYFLLLFISFSLLFSLALATLKESLEAVCSLAAVACVDVYLSRSCILPFLALIGLKKQERAAWREGFRVSFSLSHSRGFRALGCSLRQIRHFLCPSYPALLHLTWP